MRYISNGATFALLGGEIPEGSFEVTESQYNEHIQKIAKINEERGAAAIAKLAASKQAILTKLGLTQEEIDTLLS
jgi:hypothetical protein